MNDGRAGCSNQFADANNGAHIKPVAANNCVGRDLTFSQVVPEHALFIAEGAHLRSKPCAIEMRREVHHRPGLAAEAKPVDDEQNRVRQTSTRTS
jgi:hypothetical protein